MRNQAVLHPQPSKIKRRVRVLPEPPHRAAAEAAPHQREPAQRAVEPPEAVREKVVAAVPQVQALREVRRQQVPDQDPKTPVPIPKKALSSKKAKVEVSLPEAHRDREINNLG